MHNVTRSPIDIKFGHVSIWEMLIWPKYLRAPGFVTLTSILR